MSVDQQDTYGDELPPGSELCGGQYVIEGYLNAGGFGITYLARDSLNRRVVIKECFPSAMCHRTSGSVRLRSSNTEDEFAEILELFEKEARALAELQHPYIVGVHQIFHDNGTAYMAMDYVAGRNLLEIIEEEPNRFTPEDVRQLLIQCLEALDYIHSRDILHRDISPDNIIIGEDNTPVMIDFGAARESATRVSRVLSKVLTVKDGYSPQEFYLQGTAQVYSSDLYALAATFYHLLSGIAPPSSNMRVSAAARNAADPLEPLEDIEGYDEHFIDAINACLSIFPNDRLPTAPVWRDMVDMERRRKILMAAAENDRELEEKVTRLVADFRKTLAREKAAERIRAEEIAAAKRREAEEARAKAEAAARAQAAEEAAILAAEEAELRAEQEAKEQAVRAEKEAALAAAAAAVHEAAQEAANAQSTSEPGSLKRMMSGRRKFFPSFAKARGQ